MYSYEVVMIMSILGYLWGFAWCRLSGKIFDILKYSWEYYFKRCK